MGTDLRPIGLVLTAPAHIGELRLAVVVQSNLFNEEHASVTVCLLISDIADAPLFRLTVEPTPENGLKSRSQIMIDKIVALRRERVGKVVGSLDRDPMLQVNRSLALWLGLGD